ncbi:rhomboid-related protein 2 isoform X2 [Agrilus planipennis]|uniref:Rhomboid-related protein 2 isoform X2 n=1 Tax=Agrilus planipennis TaxID=224129 RepID=A0A7F5RCG9_AGRPL|nr:rhomboid-related protein 2 isoform X2 [Agrilus planipennis]
MTMESGPRSNTDASEMPLRERRNPDQHWRSVFARVDTDNDGVINMSELKAFIISQNNSEGLADHVVQRILKDGDGNNDSVLNYDEFLHLVHNPKYGQIFGQLVRRYTDSYIHFLLPRRRDPHRTVVDGAVEDATTCCPPALGMVIISLIEIVFYAIDAAKGSTVNATGPIASLFIYDPHRRYEAWRYITYMFVHIGCFHLVVNLAVQILLGVPLEMVHRWWRVLLIYFAGVIAGSLGTSLTDPSVKLAGASGGVYSLITAHISSIIMNWKEMEFPALQLLIFLIITGCDVGTAIYNRYVLNINEHIGYSAHFAGALAGLLVGIHILRNFRVTRAEKIIWWISTVTYVFLMGFAIVWNIAYVSYFPTQIYSKNF